MKWLSLILQMVASHRTLVETRALLVSAKETAEKSKRVAAFSAVCVIGGIYFIAGTIIAAIGWGMQFEANDPWRVGGILATGLWVMLGATVIVALGGWIILERDKEEEKVKEPVKAVGSPANGELRAVLEEVGIAFLKQFARSLQEPPRQEEYDRPERRNSHEHHPS